MKKFFAKILAVSCLAVVLMIAGCKSEKPEMKVKIGDQVWDGTNSTFIFKNSDALNVVVLKIYKNKGDNAAPNAVLYIPREVGSVTQTADSIAYYRMETPRIAYFDNPLDIVYVNDTVILPHYLSKSGATMEVTKMDLDNNTISMHAKGTMFDARQTYIDSVSTPKTFEIEIMAKNVKCINQLTK